MERDGRLTQLHEDFKKLEKEEKEDVNQLQQFVIIPDKGEHQLLQINLIPAGIIFFKGQSIYSNSSQMNIKAQNLGGLLRNLVVKDKQLNMLINDSAGLQILGVKHPTKSGQILILDLSVYKQSFYYSRQYLIASKKAVGKEQKHPVLNALLLLKHTNKLQNIFDALDINQETVALQAQSLIMEKYLGEDEEFYLFNRRNIVAVSKNIRLELAKGSGVKLKGRGWLFYQTNNNTQILPSFSKLTTLLIICIIMLYLTSHVLKLMKLDLSTFMI